MYSSFPLSICLICPLVPSMHLFYYSIIAYYTLTHCLPVQYDVYIEKEQPRRYPGEVPFLLHLIILKICNKSDNKFK